MSVIIGRWSAGSEEQKVAEKQEIMSILSSQNKNYRAINSFLWGHSLVLYFWWCLPWVSKPRWIPCLCAFSLVWSSDSHLMWHLQTEVSMGIEPFWSTYLQMCPQALVKVWGSNPRPFVCRAQRCKLFGHSSLASEYSFFILLVNQQQWPTNDWISLSDLRFGCV